MVSPVEIGVTRADLDARARSWRADMAPPDITPQVVITMAKRAIDDSRGVVRFVAGAFVGTAPPPPWPAGPEMLRARDRVQAHADAAEVIVRRVPDAKFASPAAVRAALLRDGGDLYDQAADLLNKFASAPRMPDILAVLPRPGDLFTGLPIYIGALVLWWAIDSGARRTRLSRL